MLSSRSRSDSMHCKITPRSNSTAVQQSRMLHDRCSKAKYIPQCKHGVEQQQAAQTEHSKLTSKAKCVRSKDEGGKVCKPPNSSTNSHCDVASCVLVWQILPTKVLADVRAEKEQQVGEERRLDGAPAQNIPPLVFTQACSACMQCMHTKITLKPLIACKTGPCLSAV